MRSGRSKANFIRENYFLTLLWQCRRCKQRPSKAWLLLWLRCNRSNVLRQIFARCASRPALILWVTSANLYQTISGAAQICRLGRTVHASVLRVWRFVVNDQAQRKGLSLSAWKTKQGYRTPLLVRRFLKRTVS